MTPMLTLPPMPEMFRAKTREAHEVTRAPTSRRMRCSAIASGRRRYTAQFSSQPAQRLDTHRASPV
jgi:hypothetical protein